MSERKFLTIIGACTLCIQLGFIKQTINIDSILTNSKNSWCNCWKSRKYTHCVQSPAFPFLLKCLWVVSIKTNVWAIASYLNIYRLYIYKSIIYILLIVLLNQLKIVKDVTKEILRWSLIQTRLCWVGVGGNIIFFK